LLFDDDPGVIYDVPFSDPPAGLEASLRPRGRPCKPATDLLSLTDDEAVED
jgi:hypothetical protein